MRFIDEVDIVAVSGKGGDGCVSFRREAHVPRGGPDGGDGGRGGSVVFEASRGRNTLADFRRNKVYRAKKGQPGSSKNMYGAKGADLVLPVPVGTVIFDRETDALLADLDHEGERFVLSGGVGGKGNTHFKSATRQTPRFAEEGRPGEERLLRLELKLLADVGLVGFPNAGKSTLISRISAARPKIASYPFTTLSPRLGVVSLGPGESFVVADIPGLIEGAAEGRGLGHRFLKHVERCDVVLHLVAPDARDGDPAADYHTLREELKSYDPALLNKPGLVVLSKIDLLDGEARERWVHALGQASGQPVHPVSAVTAEGLKELVYATWGILSTCRRQDGASK